MDGAHEVECVTFTGTVMRLRVDGKDYQIDMAGVSERLRHATPQQRENFQLSPSGYGIHWPDLDEDLSIDGLLGAKHAPPWAAARSR